MLDFLHPFISVMQGIITTGYREGIKLIRRSAKYEDQYLISILPTQKF